MKKEKSLPSTLEVKGKYIKRGRWNGCNFIKNEKYKHILGKIMPPYTNLSLFLIISSKNYIFYGKTLMKSAAIVAFTRKVSQGSSFKKESQLNSKFSIVIWCCGCAASQTFLSHSLTLSYWMRWFYDIKLSLFSKIKLNSSYFIREKKINFQSFLFWGICLSRFSSLDVSTVAPILNFC